MSHSSRMAALWLMLFIVLTGCAPKVESAITGAWAMCSAPKKENEIVFGVAYGDIFQFGEDGTFNIYPKNTFLADGAQTSGAYKLLTVKRTATNAHGTMQLTLTTPTPLDVRVPYTYTFQESKPDDRLWLATTGDHFPCQLCVLCPVTIPTQRD